MRCFRLSHSQPFQEIDIVWISKTVGVPIHRSESTFLFANGPTHFGGGGSGIIPNFLTAWTNDSRSDFSIDSTLKSVAEVMFHAPILARVKAQYRDPATWKEAVREAAEEGVQSVKLFIDRNPDGLENASYRRTPLVVRDVARQYVLDCLTQLPSGVDRVSLGEFGEGRGNWSRKRFVTPVSQDARQLVGTTAS